jgi:hypothetical protein
MVFKKHSWIKYGEFGNIVEIIVRDGTSRKIDKFICSSNDSFNRILNLLEKYGFYINKKSLKEEVKEMQKEFSSHL